MSLGNAIMAVIISSSVMDFPLYFSFQMVSLVRTNSIGDNPKIFKMPANSFLVGTFSRYLMISKSFPEFSRMANPSLDLPHLGLWYIFLFCAVSSTYLLKAL